jgi:AsmA protein
MKLLKILAGVLVAIVALFGIAALIVANLDANRFRPQIAARVKEATGRELAIGTIHLSLFPVVGVSLKDVQLGNAEGFANHTQVSVGSAAVGVRLMPLIFSRRVEVGRVELDDASIDLEVAPDGHNNWSDLHGNQAAAQHRNAAPPAAQREAGAQGTLVISSVAIRNATLHYADHKSGKSYAIDALNFKTGTIDLGRPADLALDFRTQLSDPAITAKVKLSGTARMTAEPMHFTVSDLALHVDADGAGLPNGKATVDLKGNIEGSDDSMALNDLKLKIDDSTITGKLAMTSLRQLAASFALQVDQFDLDKYSPPKKEGAAAPAEAAKSERSAEDTRIPVDALDAASLDGTLDVGRLKAQGLTLSNMHLVVKAPRGAEKHLQVTAALYGGTLGSDTAIAPGKEPHYGQSVQLKGIDVGSFSRDYLHKDKLEGRGDIDLRVTAAGQTVNQAKRSLNGPLSFSLKNAVVKGFNLAQMVRQGQALVNGQTLQDNTPQQTAQQTDLSAITGGGTIVNGVLHADRLDGESPLLRVSGAGTVDLVNETIDYLAQPTIVNTTSGQGGRNVANLSGITVPVHVTGTFAAPHYSLDVQSALKQKAVQQLTDKLGQKNPGLGSLLQGLFGGKQQNNGSQPPH